MQKNNSLKVLYVSAEVSPFAKTGGLADVAGSLPKALASMGNDVRIVMPRYKSITNKMNYLTDFPVKVGERIETCIVREIDKKLDKSGDIGVPVYFIDSYTYFDRSGIYCFYDDAERYALFCIAVLKMLPKIDFQPDIIHLNDWHTGPIALLLNEKYKNLDFYKKIKTVFTIHNLEYQGIFSKAALNLFNVDDSVFTPDKVEFYGMFNFLKTGLVYSEKINTVSENYAKEIQTEQYGEKLEGLLKSKSDDLYGIVNGISYEEFNPEKDHRIYKSYDSEDIEGKKANKIGLQKEMNLPKKDVPLIGLVSRLSGQKGLDLILDKAQTIMEHDIQFVLLGTGDPYYENFFRDLQLKYPDKFGVYIGFSEELAHRIYAGSDIFLMPSRFEPCGLGQIISLRYGTIPIVRATGGLADTIVDYDENKLEGNGFVFHEFSSNEMLRTIERALDLYTKNSDEWEQLVRKALELDFSWNEPAIKYNELYHLALGKKGMENEQKTKSKRNH